MCDSRECSYPPARIPQVRVCSQCFYLGSCWFVAVDEPWCFRCIAFVVMRTLSKENR